MNYMNFFMFSDNKATFGTVLSNSSYKFSSTFFIDYCLTRRKNSFLFFLEVSYDLTTIIYAYYITNNDTFYFDIHCPYKVN